MSSRPLLHADADQADADALAHGVGAGRDVGAEAALVALGDDLAVLDHHHAPGVAA